MYSTCLFCHSDLGRNEAIERFPVGRRLSFDAERGRLWVVCQKCGRWNLTPLEERWEAIEECERYFRDTRLRVSTDNIGLARLREGMELVRIGRPQRPEFAAWRYGEQLGRRRRETFIKVGLGLGALGAVLAGGAAVGIGIGSAGYWIWQVGNQIVQGSPDAVVARIDQREGNASTQYKVRRKHLPHLQLVTGSGGRWVGGSPPASGGWELLVPYGKKRVLQLTGDEALRAAGKLLPALNRFGASPEKAREAVEMIERHGGDPVRYFASTAAALHNARARSKNASVATLPSAVRLALEMAAHEEQERRALEGELASLEAAWKEAEEIAEIADNMFLPKSVGEWLEKRRGSREQ